MDSPVHDRVRLTQRTTPEKNTNAMKTLRTFSILFPALILLPQPKGWGQSTELLAAIEGTFKVELSDAGVRYELVDGRHLPTAYAPDALLRTVRQTAPDRYDVRIIAADGNLRMSGSYRDAALKVPHGSFEYFHMNGRLECRGEYAMGNKAGVWERYALDGSRLADRMYTGLSVERMVQMATGESEEACTAEVDF